MNADLFRGTVQKYMTMRHVKRETLQKAAPLSNKTFGLYMKDPGKFTLEQFENIMNSLNVPYEERWEILKK